MTQVDASRRARGLTQARPAGALWIALAAVSLVVVSLVLEIGTEGRDPFWLDESWTGAIIGQPSWRDAFHQIYWDVNAPLYYGLMRLWSGVFGLSDFALRAPSLICAAGAALAAALVPVPGLTRLQRLAWAAVLAWWFPTLCYAQEARCYALLLLVCTLQTLAFIRLMAAPGLKPATLWAALAATAILTHYDALYLAAVQGFIYLGRYPIRALRSWPAALAFAPAFGWLAFHWPRIAQFARPDIAWYSPLHLSQLPAVAGYMAGGGDVMLEGLALVAVSAVTLRLILRRHGADETAQPAAFGAPAWAMAASALAMVALVGVGFLRPSFTYRYLTPSAPGLLLAVVWVMSRSAGRRGGPAAMSLLAGAYLIVGGWMLASGLRMAPRRYNFEAASAAIARGPASRLVFLWDHPVDPILHPEQLSALGDFFLQRSGRPMQVVPVVLKPGEDPNARLLEAAQQPGSAILWLYDRVVQGTAAIAHPPDISGRNQGFTCRQFGSGRFGVLACEPRPRRGAASDVIYQRPGTAQPQPHAMGL